METNRNTLHACSYKALNSCSYELSTYSFLKCVFINVMLNHCVFVNQSPEENSCDNKIWIDSPVRAGEWVLTCSCFSRAIHNMSIFGAGLIVAKMHKAALHFISPCWMQWMGNQGGERKTEWVEGSQHNKGFRTVQTSFSSPGLEDTANGSSFLHPWGSQVWNLQRLSPQEHWSSNYYGESFLAPG